MFRNFWVGSDGEFVFYSHIYFSFFDCEVKLVFHVIKCHSYKFRTCSYMNDLRPPPPPPFTRLFTSGSFQFPFFNKGKVNGGGGGGWKVIHKLTLSINRPKNLSNNLNSSKRNINFVGWKAPSRLLHVFFQSFSMQMSFFNWHFHLSFPLCWK